MVFRQTKGGFVLEIRVVPNASKNEIVILDNIVKVKVTAPPVDGKANKEVVQVLARYLGIPKSKISIQRGETSKTKLVLFEVDVCPSID